MKNRLNAGDTAEMYFYRDSEGNEVDLLLPTGGRMHAIGIKAGATVNPDYFKGLKRFAAMRPTPAEHHSHPRGAKEFVFAAGRLKGAAKFLWPFRPSSMPQSRAKRRTP